MNGQNTLGRAIWAAGTVCLFLILFLPVGTAGPEPFDPQTELFSDDGGSFRTPLNRWLASPEMLGLIPLPDHLPAQ